MQNEEYGKEIGGQNEIEMFPLVANCCLFSIYSFQHGDRIRDQNFFCRGYRVIRFWGSDLIKAPYKVRHKLIVKLFGSRMQLEGLTDGERRVVADLQMKGGMLNA